MVLILINTAQLLFCLEMYVRDENILLQLRRQQKNLLRHQIYYH